MTESRMDNRGSTAAAVASTDKKGPVSSASSKLNPGAKTFVFNTSAKAWTPPSYAAPAAAPATATAPAAPAAVPAPPASAPAPAPSAPAPKSSVLKVSAKEFVPSFLATPYTPSSYMPMQPPMPAAPEPEEPTAEEDEPLYDQVEPEAVAVESPTKDTTADDEPTATDMSSSSSSSTSSAQAEPESEDLVEPAAEAEVKAEVETPEKQPVVVEVEATTSSSTAEPVETPAEAAVAARIMYTIAQLLEMEPETCPMPASVVGTQVAAIKGKDDDASAPAGSAKGGRGSRRGDSSRGLNRQNSSFGEGGRGGRGRGRGGRGGRGNAAPEPPLEDVAPLEINEETRWKPSHSKSRLDEPSDTTDAAIKEAKAILNKLSIEKFDKLSNQLIEVAVRHIDVLSGVIEMVIAKAQMEWHFSTMYAELCAKIAQTEMPAMALDENAVAQDTHKLFRKLLLSRCQKQFEVTPSKEGLDELPEEERLEKELVLKRATLGHIRFVGELYKQRMLSARIMHECIQRLFGDLTAPDEESLECLCKLLSTIGQTLETTARDQAELDLIGQYYGVIKTLGADAERLCTRVRFMLQDLLELRRNKWVARRKEAKAMTIAEVHAEVAREEKEKAKSTPGGGSSRGLPRSQSSSSLSGDKRRKDTGSSNGGGASAAWKARAAAASSSGPSSTVDADGWETVSGPRPKLTKSRSSISDRAPRHPSLSRNSSDGSSRNSFSMLSNGGGRERKDRERSHSSSSSSGSFRRGGSSSSLKDMDSSRPPRPATSPIKAKKTLATAPPPATSEPEAASDATPEPLAPAAFEKKVKGIFDEFVLLEDLDEAVQCITLLQSPAHHHLVVAHALNVGLEKGNKERAAAATLLAGLFARGLLDQEAFATPLHELLEFAEDLEIDIPKTLPYVAEMLAPSVAAGGVSLPRLVASVQHLTPNGKAAELLARVLGAVVVVADEAKAQALVQEASVDLRALLAEDQRHDEGLRALCAAHQLEFLL